MIQPQFIPRPGQTDFTDIRWAPVINCVVQFKDKILLVKRSTRLRLYPGFWNGISGFLDDQKSLAEKVQEELVEELGLEPEQIISIKLGRIFHQEEPRYNKTWIVHPMLVKIKTDVVHLDWEAQKYRWVTLAEAKQMNLLPGFDRVLASFN